MPALLTCGYARVYVYVYVCVFVCVLSPRDVWTRVGWFMVYFRSGNASISIQLLSSQPPVVLSKEDIGVAYALLDVFYCLVFLLFVLAVKSAQTDDIVRVDEEVDSESDFTVRRSLSIVIV